MTASKVPNPALSWDVFESPQFDICYALADIASPDPSLRKDLFDLPSASPLESNARALGWGRWLAVPHIVAEFRPARTITEFIARLELCDSEVAARRLIDALHHHTQSSKAAAQKLEWLNFVGVGQPEIDVVPPDERQWLDLIVNTLKCFAPSFEKAWGERRNRRVALAKRARKAMASMSLKHVIDDFDLPIETKSRGRKIKALRGGYELDVSAVGNVWLIPSLFNTRRVWNALDVSEPATLILPVGEVVTSDLRDGTPHVGPSFDPWLACRAIGDPTRGRILRMLCERALTAKEICAELSLSKATISHHLFLLKEARLILHNRNGRSTELAVNREAIAAISPGLAKALRGPEDSVNA